MNRYQVSRLGAALPDPTKKTDIISQIKETFCKQPAELVDNLVTYTGYAKWTVFGLVGLTVVAMFGPPIFRLASKKKESQP